MVHEVPNAVTTPWASWSTAHHDQDTYEVSHGHGVAEHGMGLPVYTDTLRSVQ